MRLVVEALAESGRGRSTTPGKQYVDDGDVGAHGWRMPAAAVDLGVGEAEEAGPSAALEVEGEGRLSAGYGTHLDGGVRGTSVIGMFCTCTSTLVLPAAARVCRRRRR